ncbi:MAG: PAS domain S-box protein, partial [Caldilineae bacterium]
MPHPIRILYVDDNPFDRELVRDALSHADDAFSLAEADSRTEFETLLQNEQFDLVLSDFNILGFEGLEVLEAVHATDPNLPVVLITGTGSEEIAVQAIKQGAADYIIKTPQHIRRLPLTIQTVLERKHLQQEREAARRELQRRNRELTLLNRVIAACMTQTDIEAILEVVCRELALALDAPHTAAALLNRAKTEALVVAEYRTDDRPSALNQIIPVIKSPAYQVLLADKAPLLVADARTDERLAATRRAMVEYGWASLILLPLVVEDEVLGAVGLSRPQPASFTPEDLELAWSVAGQVSGALAHAHAERERRLLATAIEQAAESVVITDSAGTILYVNPAFEAVTGYTRAEAIGRNPRILKSGKQDPAFYRHLWQTITAGEVWHGKFVNRHKDGSLFTEEATITPVRDAGGRITHFVAVKRNTTREEHLEEQFRQVQKMEALGRLTSGITHDFNNILTAINGFAELLKMRLPPDDPHRPLVEKILRSGQDAAELVSQLLTFSRKEAQAPQPLNLNRIVEGTEAMLRRVIG